MLELMRLASHVVIPQVTLGVFHLRHPQLALIKYWLLAVVVREALAMARVRLAAEEVAESFPLPKRLTAGLLILWKQEPVLLELRILSI